ANPLIPAPKEKVDALRAELGIAEGDRVVGMSARMEEVKGHIYLIEAARILRDRGFQNLKVLMIGCGSTEEILKEKAREYQLEDCVLFPGFVSNVAPYLQIMDVIVNCSFGTEATSMALIEAMSLAKPAIATDYGGNAVIIENGKNGYIIPQKSASNLADAIEKFYSADSRRVEMSKVAYSKYICHLTGKIMTGKVEQLYEKEYKLRCKK
ncbi:MAG: glycosyltransferase family 4 protein, partial [Clostridia bacterium]|nr:glycosyltransferase family 4 protein [Clostridia bacterium]